MKTGRSHQPRSWLWAVSLAALTLCWTEPFAAQDLGGYTIQNFHTELTIERNSDMTVEERIVVAFSEPRHGIYRTIPVRYSDPKGYAYSLGLRLLEVVDDQGVEYQTQVSNQGQYVNIRIGDPDVTVEGVVVYIVRYRVRDALTDFPEFDEIYWNATGHEWNAPIARSSATVRLPAPVDAGQLRVAGYTGAFGQVEQAVEVTHPDPGSVHFRTTRPLLPMEGLTVAVGFPKGLVSWPSPGQRAGRLFADNWVVLLPLGWLAFLIGRYRRHGRDPDAGGPVMVAYEPPPGLTAGAVGTLLDERVDLADITAVVVDLAIRRYLTIKEETRERLFGLFDQEETVFVRESAAGKPDLLPHEQRVVSALFEKGDEVRTADLKNSFYTHLPLIRQSLFDRLSADGYFEASPEKVRQRWVLFGVLAGIITGFIAFGWLSARGHGPPAVPAIPIVTGLLTAGIFMAFSGAMPRRTPRGVAARKWALGFQEFASRVEGERLAEAAADRRYQFEALLPYAMALGVASEWARKYEGIYERNAPSWYVGTRSGVGFSTSSFERSLSGAMAKTGDTMRSSPRSSSGSGGGGSSGGGGGGGGGGSW